MTASIAAPVAMVDYGGTVAGVDNVNLDGFFDTGVVGDLAGQLWVFRFFEPGKRNGLIRADHELGRCARLRDGPRRRDRVDDRRERHE